MDSGVVSCLSDEPIYEALAAIAVEGSLNVVARSSDIEGAVTVYLTDVQPRPALESILEAHSLELVTLACGSPPIYSVVPQLHGPWSSRLPLENVVFGPTDTTPSSISIDLTLQDVSLGKALTEMARLARVNISYDTNLNAIGHISVDVRQAGSEELLWALLRFHPVRVSRSTSLGGYSVSYQPPHIFPPPPTRPTEPESALPLRVQALIAGGLVIAVLLTMWALKNG